MSVDGGITHPSVLAVAVEPARIAVIAGAPDVSVEELARKVMQALDLDS